MIANPRWKRGFRRKFEAERESREKFSARGQSPSHFCCRGLAFSENAEKIFAHEHLAAFKEVDELLDRGLGIGDGRYGVERSAYRRNRRCDPRTHDYAGMRNGGEQGPQKGLLFF